VSWEARPLFSQLERVASRHPHQVALIDEGRQLSWGEVLSEVDRVARGLHHLGLQKDDVVGLWMHNCASWVTIRLALAQLGCVLVPLNTHFTTDEARYCLAHSRARAVIFPAEHFGIDFASKAADLLDEARCAQDLRQLEFGVCLDGRPKGSAVELERLITEADDDRELPDPAQIDPEDTTLIIYTSGTTGYPKGVRHSHALLRHMDAMAQQMGLTESDRFLAHMPFFYAGAGIAVILPALLTGASIVCVDRFDASEALEQIERHHCTVVNGIPTHFTMLLDSPTLREVDVSSARLGWIGGADIPAALVQQASEDLGMTLISGYGLTEVMSTVTMSRVDDSLDDVCHAVGFPISPDYEVGIFESQASAALPAGREGEIRVRGYPVMQGYLDDQDATRAAITEDGWLCTGDLGFVGTDGRLRITGRLKDLIVVGGANVYPAEIERVLRQIPGVTQCCVVPVPHRRLGEVGYAFVQRAAPDADCNSDDVIAFCRNHLARFKVPYHVDVVDQLPLTSSGKVQRFALRELALERIKSHG
jgi:acyl-CoA synthetase (AMP-forming)/AMP-acid ligase II